MALRSVFGNWRRRRPRLEWLEGRTLLSVSPIDAAPTLQFNARHEMQASHFLASPAEFDLYRVKLEAGQTIEAGIAALMREAKQRRVYLHVSWNQLTEHRALSSLLRVFDAFGALLWPSMIRWR